MRVLKLGIPAEALHNGLKGIRMQRLGQVVALFGPNGAGKTRLLWTIDWIIRQDMEWSEKYVELQGKRASEFLRLLKSWQDDVKGLNDEKNRVLSSGESDSAIKSEQLRARIEERTRAIASMDEKIKMLASYPERIPEWYSSAPTKDSFIIRLQPDLTVLSKLGPMSSFDISTAVTNHLSLLDKPDQVSPGVIPFFYALAQAASNEGNSNVVGPMQEFRLRLFRLAQDLVRKMLRTELSFAYDDSWGSVVPTLGGQEINVAQLSDGQKLLLYYTSCLLVKTAVRHETSRNLRLDGAIIILDEPELHLHPAAVVEVVERLRDVVGSDGQIWIASHALSLLRFCCGKV